MYHVGVACRPRTLTLGGSLASKSNLGGQAAPTKTMEFVMPMRISCSRYKSSMERTDLWRDKRTDGQQETP